MKQMTGRKYYLFQGPHAEMHSCYFVIEGNFIYYLLLAALIVSCVCDVVNLHEKEACAKSSGIYLQVSLNLMGARALSVSAMGS